MATGKHEQQEAIDYWNDKAGFFASDKRKKQNRRMTELYESSCWRFIEPALPSGTDGRILEAGCGTGRWVYKLAPMGYKLDLLDFSEEMVRHAKAQIKHRGLENHVTGYHIQDICNMAALPDNSFNLVLATGMPLSLCDAPERAIAELFRITSPGGHVICDVKNKFRAALDMASKNNISQLLNALNNGRVVTDSGQAHCCFSYQELESLFMNQGFDLCHVSALLPFFQVPPSKKQVEVLDDDKIFNQINNIFQALSEEPGVIGLSSRLLVVARART